MFDVETAIFPDSCEGNDFLCGNDLSAFIERAPDGTVCVSSYSPGIVGMLARAYPAICAGKIDGHIPWGPNNQYQLYWCLATRCGAVPAHIKALIARAIDDQPA